MKHQRELDTFNVNIAESKCEKNKNLEKCHTGKCFTFNWYHNQGLPCPYYIPPESERGFLKNLDEIYGIKIRRNYFNVLVYALLSLLIMMIIFEILLAKNTSLTVHFLVEVIIYMSIMIVPFVILSLLNKHLFGRLVCVVNESGLYCNQKMLKWIQINRVTYNIDLPGGYTSMVHCSLKIEYDSGCTLIIPFAPKDILKKIKMNCPNIYVGLDTSSKVLVGIFIAMPILVPLAIFIVKGQ